MALRFKTVAAGQVYRHIVLAVHHRPTSTWGALGLSRRKELMYKELRYSSLSELVTDFKVSAAHLFAARLNRVNICQPNTAPLPAVFHSGVVRRLVARGSQGDGRCMQWRPCFRPLVPGLAAAKPTPPMVA